VEQGLLPNDGKLLTHLATAVATVTPSPISTPRLIPKAP
jgi:hypothetical protein